ncbi:IclR family transcriptional regulator [Prauserella alba]|uniref:IclR family transcriptional regulator n=1 Tax=Prauserella alba TaxID=176898 RepID=A0ABN1VHA5_9PSEU|nr:IclR family transcriptional regulator [Prauserella alba]MCP2182739.1 transcriptional regulator, IclR family [Prauserella alba]
MKNKPAYSVESVDHALRLAVCLQQEGAMGVTEAAARLGVARSTAHRLLAMLVYRDFAEQGVDRRYVAGPILRVPNRPERVVGLRDLAVPQLRTLMRRTGESSNAMVLHGRQVQMVATVECEHVLRVGDREGRLLPADRASGGRALLARLGRADLAARYDGETGDAFEEVERVVRQARRRGFAINDQSTEAGLTAIGCALEESPGFPPIALSVAMPTARYHRRLLPDIVGALRETSAALEADLRERANAPD